ncbi:hypothetical protein TNCV_4622661 [Trichonephila clavipes]|nr:hypothetical protein TNCV_4622661 [Trichonephila clavipes]
MTRTISQPAPPSPNIHTTLTGGLLASTDLTCISPLQPATPSGFSVARELELMTTRGSQNSSRQRVKCTPAVSRSFESHTARFYPNFEVEHPGGGQRPLTSLPLPSTSQEDLRLEGYLDYLYAAKALYIYKHASLLRDSIPGSTAQQSTSCSTIWDRPLHLT